MGGNVTLDGVQKGSFTFDELERKVNGTYNRGELRLGEDGKLHRMNNHVWGLAKLWNDKTSDIQQNIDVRNAVYESIKNKFSRNAGTWSYLSVAREFLLGRENFTKPLSREEVRLIISQLKNIANRQPLDQRLGMLQRNLTALKREAVGLGNTSNRLSGENDAMYDDYRSKSDNPERYERLVEIDEVVARIGDLEKALRKTYPNFDELDRRLKSDDQSPELNQLKSDESYRNLVRERDDLKAKRGAAGIKDDRKGGTVGYFESRRKYTEHQAAMAAVEANTARQNRVQAEINSLRGLLASAGDFALRLSAARQNALAPGRRTVNEGDEGQVLRKDGLDAAFSAFDRRVEDEVRRGFKLQAYVIKNFFEPFESVLLSQLSEHAGNDLEQARGIQVEFTKFITRAAANFDQDFENGFAPGRCCADFLRANCERLGSTLAASFAKLSEQKGRRLDYRMLLTDAVDCLDAARPNFLPGDEGGKAVALMVQELRRLANLDKVEQPLPKFANNDPVAVAVMDVTVEGFGQKVDRAIISMKSDPDTDEAKIFELNEESSEEDFSDAERLCAEKLVSLLSDAVGDLDSLCDAQQVANLQWTVGTQGGKSFDEFVDGLCEIIRRSSRKAVDGNVRNRLVDLVLVAGDRLGRLVDPKSVQARKIAQVFYAKSRAALLGEASEPKPVSEKDKIECVKNQLAKALAEAKEKLGANYDLALEDLLHNVSEDTFDKFIGELEKRLREMGNALCQALADKAEGLEFILD